MGRLVTLDDPALTEWIIPAYLVNYDKRNPVWPNDLFPHHCTFYAQLTKNLPVDLKIKLRRFCEQSLNGDVCVMQEYDEFMQAIWIFYFQFDTDLDMFKNNWIEFINQNNL